MNDLLYPSLDAHGGRRNWTMISEPLPAAVGIEYGRCAALGDFLF